MREEKNKSKETETTPEELRPLTSQQELFCYQYIIDRNATQAAIRSKYSRASATVMGSKLLTYSNIKARVNELIKKQLDELSLDAKLVLRELLNSAFLDISDAYDQDGNVKPIHEMPEPLRRAIVSIESDEIYAGTGKLRQIIGTAKKIKIHDRLAALKLLGTYLKLFKEEIHIDGLEDLAEEIKRGRERAKNCRKNKQEEKPTE